jgi:hypothetical protein
MFNSTTNSSSILDNTNFADKNNDDSIVMNNIGDLWNDNHTTITVADAAATATMSIATTAPAWMIDFVKFRKRLFLQTVEPIIVQLLGPPEEQARHQYSQQLVSSSILHQYDRYRSDYSHLIDIDNEFNLSSFHDNTTAQTTNLNNISTSSSSSSSSSLLIHDHIHQHRKLGFLPGYVENAASFHETSMTFATLITLFVTMATILLIFLSCFYHNQK